MKGVYCPSHYWRPVFHELYGVDADDADDDLIVDFRQGVIASATVQGIELIKLKKDEALFNVRINDKGNLVMTVGQDIKSLGLKRTAFALARKVEEGAEV